MLQKKNSYLSQGSYSWSSPSLWEHMLLVLSSRSRTQWWLGGSSSLHQCTEISEHRYREEQKHYMKTEKHQRDRIFFTKCYSIIMWWILIRKQDNRSKTTKLIHHPSHESHLPAVPHLLWRQSNRPVWELDWKRFQILHLQMMAWRWPSKKSQIYLIFLLKCYEYDFTYK